MLDSSPASLNAPAPAPAADPALATGAQTPAPSSSSLPHDAPEGDGDEQNVFYGVWDRQV